VGQRAFALPKRYSLLFHISSPFLLLLQLLTQELFLNDKGLSQEQTARSADYKGLRRL
jgi:hypothetical protein